MSWTVRKNPRSAFFRQFVDFVNNDIYFEWSVLFEVVSLAFSPVRPGFASMSPHRSKSEVLHTTRRKDFEIPNRHFFTNLIPFVLFCLPCLLGWIFRPIRTSHICISIIFILFTRIFVGKHLYINRITFFSYFFSRSSLPHMFTIWHPDMFDS